MESADGQTQENSGEEAWNTGRELFRAQRYEEAIPFLEQVLEQAAAATTLAATSAPPAGNEGDAAPDDSSFHGRILGYLGMAQFSTGRNADAANTFAQAIAQTPDKPRLHYNLGNALFADDRLPEARRQYEIALFLDPDYEEAERALVVVGAELHSSAFADGRAAAPFAWKPINEPDEPARPEIAVEASVVPARNGAHGPEHGNGRTAVREKDNENAPSLEEKRKAAREATKSARAELDARLAQEQELLTALSSLRGVRQAVADCRHTLAAREREEQEIVGAWLTELVREPNENVS